jgi:hypothetical protein
MKIRHPFGPGGSGQPRPPNPLGPARPPSKVRRTTPYLPRAEPGDGIPNGFGLRGGAGTVIWASDPRGTAPDIVIDFAVAFGHCGDADPAGATWAFLRANGRQIWQLGDWHSFDNGSATVDLYYGTETQTANATIAAAEGADRTPAFRGMVYAVFTDFPLAEFDYQLPAITARLWNSMIEGVGTNASTNPAHPNGRNIRNFINLLAEDLGLDTDADLDLPEDIYWGTSGVVLTEEESFGELMRRIGRYYGFDFYEAEAIKFVRREFTAVDYSVPAADLLEQGDAGLWTSRPPVDETPLELSVSFINPFTPSLFEVEQRSARRILFPVRTTHSDRRDHWAVPIVATVENASGHVGLALFRESEESVVHSGKLSHEYLRMEPCDIVGLTAGDTSYEVIIDEVEIGSDLSVSFKAVNFVTHEDIEVGLGDEE